MTAAERRRLPSWKDFSELTKPRLVSLVLMSTAAGFFLADGNETQGAQAFLNALAATGLVAAGSMALNQWLEWEHDAKMPRTSRRPIPAGKISPRQALGAGLALSAAGLIYLAWAANVLAVFLAAATLLSYLFLYTPLKRRTSLNTIAGAIPGALPPMIGWAAATGHLHYGAWVLFSILFLWQIPHFLAIAWLYRREYYDAGFVMLSGDGTDAPRVARQAVIFSAMLLPVSLMPTLCGMSGILYFFSALILGFALLAVSISGLRDLDSKARLLLRASIFYLSVLLLIMVVDKP
ncbi:MAG: protoheme IX farnesyltransferase [Candidatus Omnitrophica bacterium]|nr:protoheme IX farnesyltransferase [Candidatus Omnitrophota bacterium]